MSGYWNHFNESMAKSLLGKINYKQGLSANWKWEHFNDKLKRLVTLWTLYRCWNNVQCVQVTYTLSTPSVYPRKNVRCRQFPFNVRSTSSQHYLDVVQASKQRYMDIVRRRPNIIWTLYRRQNNVIWTLYRRRLNIVEGVQSLTRGLIY